jgi:hypothetical protein
VIDPSIHPTRALLFDFAFTFVGFKVPAGVTWSLRGGMEMIDQERCGGGGGERGELRR